MTPAAAKYGTDPITYRVHHPKLLPQNPEDGGQLSAMLKLIIYNASFGRRWRASLRRLAFPTCNELAFRLPRQSAHVVLGQHQADRHAEGADGIASMRNEART